MQVIQSQTLSEEQKINELNIIFMKHEKDDINKLMNVIDVETFTCINSKLNEIQSDLEFVLLNIIEIFAIHNSEDSNQQNLSINKTNSSIHDILDKSGLINKLEEIFKQRIETQQLSFSQSYALITEQITRIYLVIMKGLDINEDILELCAQVITQSINSFIQSLKNNVNEQQEYNFSVNEDNLDIRIQSMIKLLNSLIIIIENNVSNRYFLSTKLHIHKQISQLLHFNCYSELKCPYNINVKGNIFLFDLQAAAYNSLQYLIICSNEEQTYHHQKHNIFDHLSLIFQSFIKHRLNDQYQNQYCVISTHNNISSLIIASLQLLCNIFFNNHYNCHEAQSTSNLIHGLVKLCKYQNDGKISQDTLFEVIKIRRSSFMCIKEILWIIGSKIHPQLSRACYIGALISSASINDEYIQTDNETSRILYSVNSFIEKICNFRSNQSVYPQTVHIQTAEEQIEEEGGLEEIEAHILSVKQIDGIKRESIDLKMMLLNQYILSAW